MNNNINTLLNFLTDLGEIRKADKNAVEYSSTSDNTMAVSSLYRPKYRYFPKSKTELRKIIVERILEENYNYECDLNDIDVSGVGNNLKHLFNYLDGSFHDGFWKVQKKQNGIDITKFNGHIENWDVSNVEDMGFMFSDCENFDQDLSGWDVHNVKNMNNMFEKCSSFNKDISDWKVYNVKTMFSMFYDCCSFNQNISEWDVHNVVDMGNMFVGCTIFNKPLKKWIVSNVTNMFGMFWGCSAFRQNISGWDVSNVENYSYCFAECPNMPENYKPKFNPSFKDPYELKNPSREIKWV